MEESEKVIYKCSCPRPNGGVCGFETTDKNAYCPHDNIIVSSGEKYVPEKLVKVCPLCKQPLPTQKVEMSRIPKPVSPIDPSPKAKPARPIGSEMQKESDPGRVRGQVFK
jgi:hypothetical protein